MKIDIEKKEKRNNMLKKVKDKISQPNVVFTISMIILVVLTALFIVFIEISIEITSPEVIHEVIEGEVTNVEYVKYESDNSFHTKGEIKYLVVTFNDEETYNIRYKGDIDFTVNSKLIIELSHIEGADIYYIEQIIKIPDGE